MSLFTANHPYAQPGQITLLPTPQRIGAATGYCGRGVVMAFIDSGFYPHPEIADRVLVHVDASTSHVVEQTAGYDSGDLGWHGQMTSVIAAGDGRWSDGRFRGVASGACLVLVRVATPRGHVKESDILRGLRWLIDAGPRYRVRIVNISVGGDFVSTDPDHPLHRAVRRLHQMGVVVVAASGNRLADQVVPPASAAEAITVGGVDDHNTLDSGQWTPYHSNYGFDWEGRPKPDLIAPAAWVPGPIMPETVVAREARWLGPILGAHHEDELRDLLGRGYADLGLSRAQAHDLPGEVYGMLQARINTHKIIDSYHQHVDGTSVAAPIVSAVIAQMLEAAPHLSPDTIRTILRETARPLPDVAPERQGAGVLGAAAAVARAAEYAMERKLG